MIAIGELLTIDFTGPLPWVALLVISWGTLIFFILKGLLVPKPYHDVFVRLAETERANRTALEATVREQNKALVAIADGVEAIKAATAEPWWRRGGR